MRRKTRSIRGAKVLASTDEAVSAGVPLCSGGRYGQIIANKPLWSLCFFLLSFSLCLFLSPAEAQVTPNFSYDSSLQFGSAGVERANDVIVDANGDAFVVGNTSGELPSGSTPPNTKLGGSDAYIAKYNSSTKQLEWTRQFGTSSEDTAEFVAIRPTDNQIYIAGFTGSGTGYVARFDRAGNGGIVYTFGNRKAR